MADDQLPRYRTGNRNARNIYLVTADRDGSDVDTHVGCVFDPIDGQFVVDALNEKLARQRLEA